MTFAQSEGALNRAAPAITRHVVEKGETQLARAITMRVYEAKLVYSLLSLGDETHLEQPEAVVEYLRSAFDEHSMQEAFF